MAERKSRVKQDNCIHFDVFIKSTTSFNCHRFDISRGSANAIMYISAYMYISARRACNSSQQASIIIIIPASSLISFFPVSFPNEGKNCCSRDCGNEGGWFVCNCNLWPRHDRDGWHQWRIHGGDGIVAVAVVARGSGM